MERKLRVSQRECVSLWKVLAGSYQQTDSLSDLFLLIFLPFETHTRILQLLSSTNVRKTILVLGSSKWYNTLQQYSPRQLYLTKFTSCFGDLAHRQGVSYSSLIWSGAAAALDFWTVSPCLKSHFPFPPCLPHFPDHQSFNAKQNTFLIILLLWWWHANFCNKCTTQILEFPAHQLLQENFPRSPQKLSNAQRPPLATASCGWDFWLVWTVMRSFLLPLVCLPDHDLRIFIIGLGFFPVGKKLLWQRGRRWGCCLAMNVSLPCFTQTSFTTTCNLLGLSYPPYLAEMVGRKKCIKITAVSAALGIRTCWKAQLMTNTSRDQHLWPKRT